MKWWDNIKNFFTREVPYLASNELDNIFDHERVDFNAEEFDRIDESFRMYAGDYPEVEYINSKGDKKKRPYMHLNMMNEVSKHLGSILFNEKAQIRFAGEEDESEANAKFDIDFIKHVLQHNDFNKNFSKYIQVMLATGGLAVKPYYDVTTGEFEFSWALADTFIPLRSNSNAISEAVIPSHSKEVIGDTKYYYTLLEFHEWFDDGYVITNELYRSEKADILGKEVSLDEQYEGLEPETVYYNFTRPNFAYVSPFGFNNISPQSPLGLGVTDNAKTTLEQINNTYDHYHWEIKQGKRRVIVSDHFLRTKPDHNGRPRQYFDEDTDVYLGLPGGMDDMRYQDITSDIRSSSYIESINKFISTLEMQVGLSAGTFTFDGKSVKTATEVVSENSMTYRTRNSHLTNVEQFIQELIISLCELASETYNENGQQIYTDEIPKREDINVDFDDGIFQDKQTELEYVGKAVTFGLMPAQKGIEQLQGLSEEDAKKWIQMIQAERMGQDPTEQQAENEESLFGAEE